jgi:hypothetical protein
MKRIKLTRGEFALVSNIDYAYLNQWKWFAVKNGKTFYAVHQECQRLVLMHRVILKRLGVKNLKFTDHRDGNGLNNQRRNIRPATKLQNNRNRRIEVGNNSGYKGVHWCKCRNKWRSVIRVDGKLKSLGRFHDPIEAARAYNKAAKKYFGKFAWLNKIST